MAAYSMCKTDLPDFIFKIGHIGRHSLMALNNRCRLIDAASFLARLLELLYTAQVIPKLKK